MAVAIVVGAVPTVLVGVGVVDVGVHSPAGHLVLNALNAFVALLVAFLVHGRFLRHRQLRDLLLSQGLFLLALTGLGMPFVSHLLPRDSAEDIAIWLPLTVRVMGVGLLAAAAAVGERRLGRRGRHGWPLVMPVAAVGLFAALLWIFAPHLPTAFDFGARPSRDELPLLTGHPVLLVAQALGAAGFTLAAAIFARQAVRSRDELLSWLGPAFVLGGFARLNYLLFPSVYTDWLYTGDLLRMGCHVLLLVGATREIRAHWDAQAELAVLEDRRRLARELHDGVIQELNLIRAEGHGLAEDDASRASILSACDRALDEARSAVQALGSSTGEPLGASLRRAVDQLHDRYDVRVAFDLDTVLDVTPEQRHALVRIAREAVHNAARHGCASNITVTLRQNDDGRMMSVRDDGTGFVVPPEGDGDGYGLTSMRDRARGLPGVAEIASQPGEGSEVSVRW